MGTDRYAYQSRLRRISPMPKLLLTGSALVLCLLCDSVTVGLVTLLGMWGLVTALGGLSPRVFLRFLCIPMAFLAVGCVTILINSYPQGAPVLLAVPVGERLWGFDGAALLRAGRLFCKALGAVGAMYFLALNTPMTDVTMALERLHVPHLMVELMELIYRFIFVLTETASRIRLAQESRLGSPGVAEGGSGVYRPGVPRLQRKPGHPVRRLCAGGVALPADGGGGGGSAGGMVFREEGDGMMEAAIEARELRYIYEDGTAALKGINLRAERGKITGILGANGAGKSTLFLNLNGVLQPSDGEILLDGVPVKRDRKGLTELRRRVGIVFQDPDDQLFSADVYRDISFGAVNLGLPEAEVRRRVEAAMERTGVSHLRDKPTHALSFGQKKRVAIAGVLVMEPEALILDEPTAGLDPQGVSDLLELLTSLRDSQGMTILMATHDMDVVPLCCDYAYLLGGGSVLAQGTPEELFTKAELLRANHLRLPRIAHLMAILRDRDGLDVTPVGTIGAARRELLRLLKQEELL